MAVGTALAPTRINSNVFQLRVLFLQPRTRASIHLPSAVGVQFQEIGSELVDYLIKIVKPRTESCIRPIDLQRVRVMPLRRINFLGRITSSMLQIQQVEYLDLVRKVASRKKVNGFEGSRSFL